MTHSDLPWSTMETDRGPSAPEKQIKFFEPPFSFFVQQVIKQDKMYWILFFLNIPVDT